MKTLLTILLVIGTNSVAWLSAQPVPTITDNHQELTDNGFVYIEPSRDQKKAMDTALSALQLVRRTETVCDTVEQARTLLLRSINIAAGNMRACTEYKSFFWFSRLDWAKEDDRTFKSGFAVKKGTGEIYQWEESTAKMKSLGSRSLPNPL